MLGDQRPREHPQRGGEDERRRQREESERARVREVQERELREIKVKLEDPTYVQRLKQAMAMVEQQEESRKRSGGNVGGPA